MIKLLLVDDESGVLESAKMFFKSKEDYKLFFAETGGKALQIAKRKRPELVVLDIMIEDISGEEVFKGLKKINAEIKIILLSGLEKEKIAEKAKQLGANGYLSKPFNVFKLEEYFKQVVPELYSQT